MASAGKFREKAVFQRLSEGDVDAYGNVYSGWSTIAARWADMKERTGKEAIQGGVLSDVGVATMRCRADSTTSAVTSADRVVLRGFIWAIKDAIQIDAKATLVEFTLERGVAS